VEVLPGHLQRVPPGQDPGQAEVLSRGPRDRILDAATALFAKRGYAGTTIEHIVKRAGIARATFYESFENREDCLLACVDSGFGTVKVEIAEANEGTADWPSGVAAALEALVTFAVAEPAVVRTCLIECQTAGPRAMDRYDAALQEFIPLLLPGRELAADGEELPQTLEESLIGGVIWMIRKRLLRGEVESVPALLPTMVEFCLAPYLGDERAAQLAAAR
jgi:AcrR family transcriptional regulator